MKESAEPDLVHPELTAAPGRPSSPSQIMTPELMAAAKRRLKFVGALNALIATMFFVLTLILDLPMVSPTSRAIAISALGLAVLTSLALLWLSFRLEAPVLLDVAVAYEIIQGFFISVQYHAAPIEMQAGSRAWPAVAVWVIIFCLLIPNTRRKMFFATIATAAMDPAGLAVHILAGVPVPALSKLVLSFFPTVIVTVVALLLSRILYDLSVAVKRAHDLGSYRLVRPLGQGGMGEVWEAEHRLLARSAAIKLIRPDRFGAGAAEMTARFEREARATARLSSPHTVEIYDFGVTEEGAFYYVMELLTGCDADTLVTRHGPLPPERAVFLLLQICKSLEEAHERDLVHRDIKPANIFVCRLGMEYDFVKVLDFGLVKSVGLGTDPGLTAADVVAGTPEYMAPEIARGERNYDGRADIYSLGCVAYWFVTGKPVFAGATPVDILIEHVRTPPQPPSRKSGLPVPPALEELVLACLEKDPARRPQSARELATRLEAIRLEPWTPARAAAWWRETDVGGAASEMATIGLETPSSRLIAPAR